MTRRLLVVEPDAATRGLMNRVLRAAGYAVEEFASVHHARLLLDDQAFDLAIVDEFGAGATPLGEVRFLREWYPRVPVIASGTILSQANLIELIRVDVGDVLLKPFTPAELRDAVSRTLARAMPSGLESMEFVAAVTAARRAIARGRPDEAARPLVRAYASAPLDPEVVALEALRAEVEGRDEDAVRFYRAALAVRHEESSEGPDPHDGLTRLAMYAGARPVATLRSAFAQAEQWIVEQPSRAPAAPSGDGGGSPHVIVLAIALAIDEPGTVYFRESEQRAFALLTTDLRALRAAPLLAQIGGGRIVAVGGAVGVDVDRLATSRDESRVRSSAAPGLRRSEP